MRYVMRESFLSIMGAMRCDAYGIPTRNGGADVRRVRNDGVSFVCLRAQTFYVWWMVPYYKMPSPQAWMGRYEAGLKQAALYSRLRAEGMEPREVGLQADDAWRRGAQESSSSSSSADAAATLARLAAGEL